MKCLQLPHQMADYLCPINGLCDIYEWKTGQRIPEELLFYSRIGFQMISNKRVQVPKMIFLGHGSIGKRLLEFWQDVIGYGLVADEGKSFKTALPQIRELIDRGMPVILFGLDMYYLPFHTGFYRQVHIPGHVVLMVGYDEEHVYVHDNSRMGVQTLPLTDLQCAWGEPYLNLSKRNCYFGIDMSTPDRDIPAVLRRGFAKTSDLYLNPPVSFMGRTGFGRFLREYPAWPQQYPPEVLARIYLHLVEFTGSILPEVPPVLGGSPLGFENPHQGGRDRYAEALRKYRAAFGTAKWDAAAAELKRSGELIGKIIAGFTGDLCRQDFSGHERYLPLFAELQTVEEAVVRRFE